MIKQFLTVVPFLFAIACASTPAKTESTPVPAPVQANAWDGKSPVEVCIDAAVAICSKVAQCEGDVDGCANTLGEYCTRVVAVIDVKTVYELCIPEVNNSTCQSDFPQSCVGIFTVENE